MVASTGKEETKDFLERLGASKVIGREAVDDQSGKPMLKEQ